MPDRVPGTQPPFTVGDLKRAIPAHCFERSLVRSFGHLAADLAVVGALYWSTQWIDHPSVPPAMATYLLWPLYWFLQGAFQTGLWVLAHECGHGGFSDSEAINDSVGLVLHSALLVPYYSWKHSHRRHHSNTGSMEGDEVFVPATKSQIGAVAEALDSAPGKAVALLFTFTLGWPFYLLFNIASREYKGHTWVNHFNPYSPIFNKSERSSIVVSDLALLSFAGLLGYLGMTHGFGWLAKVYGIPYLGVNFWLVLITLLQHTDAALPHYRGDDWNWLKGALCTVDRDFGFFLNHVHHHIADTHVCHHLFSYLPFYHAQEATRALKEVMGPYYRFDSTPIPVALWNSLSECGYVEDEGAVTGPLWFKPISEKRKEAKAAKAA